MTLKELRQQKNISLKEIANIFETDIYTILKVEDYYIVPDLSILSEILNMPELEYNI